VLIRVKKRDKSVIYKYKFFNLSFIGSLVFFLLLQLSCGKSPEPPKKPIIVRKPIVAIKPKKEIRPQKGKGAIVTVLKKEKDKTKLPSQTVEKVEKKEKERLVYVYNPKGKIDPFKPLFDIEVGSAASVKRHRDRNIPLTPLQKVELSQLRLVGIVFSGKEKRALIEDASWKGYIVTKGTYIGTHFGKVIEILNDRIIIEEEIEDLLGRIRLRKTEMKLQTKVREG